MKQEKKKTIHGYTKGEIPKAVEPKRPDTSYIDPDGLLSHPYSKLTYIISKGANNVANPNSDPH